MTEVDVRWATVDDARGVAIVHVAAWRAAYRGLIDQQVLDALDVDRRAAGWTGWIERALAGMPVDGRVPHRLLVAEVDGTIAGWASFGAGRDEGMQRLGELAGLYVHPDRWARGIGGALIRRTERELSEEGYPEAYLWVLRGNDRAAGFYTAHGWKPDGGEKLGEAGGATELPELRHRRTLEGAGATSSSR